jgi:hypothetical protein
MRGQIRLSLDSRGEYEITYVEVNGITTHDTEGGE